MTAAHGGCPNEGHVCQRWPCKVVSQGAILGRLGKSSLANGTFLAFESSLASRSSHEADVRKHLRRHDGAMKRQYTLHQSGDARWQVYILQP